MDLNTHCSSYSTVWCFKPPQSDRKARFAQDFFPRLDLCANTSIFICDLQLTAVSRSATWPQQTFCWTTETVATLTKLNKAVVQACISWIVYCGKIWWQSISFLTLRTKRHKAAWVEASFHLLNLQPPVSWSSVLRSFIFQWWESTQLEKKHMNLSETQPSGQQDSENHI